MVVYKSIKVQLGQSQDLMMSIQNSKYLKYKYTYENAGFFILCMDDFKILKIFIQLLIFSTIFHRETLQAPTPHPQRPNMSFLVDKIDMWRFPKNTSQSASVPDLSTELV